MTLGQTYDVAAMVQLHWPHSALDDAAPDAWHRYLEAFDAADVEAAVNELVASGREFAPNVGTIVQTVSARLADIPEWDEAWAELDVMIRRRGAARPPALGDFTHRLIADFAIPAWTELCQGPAPGTSGFGTHYAQQREAYKAMGARRQRDVGLAAIGSPRRSNAPRSLEAALADLELPTVPPVLELIHGGERR